VKSLPAIFLSTLLMVPAQAAVVIPSNSDSGPLESPEDLSSASTAPSDPAADDVTGGRTAAVVPEPAAALLGSLGLLALLRRRRVR
jgi:hypothetical protein